MITLTYNTRMAIREIGGRASRDFRDLQILLDMIVALDDRDITVNTLEWVLCVEEKR